MGPSGDSWHGWLENGPNLKMYSLLKMGISYCHVSLLEGSWKIDGQGFSKLNRAQLKIDASDGPGLKRKGIILQLVWFSGVNMLVSGKVQYDLGHVSKMWNWKHISKFRPKQSMYGIFT